MTSSGYPRIAKLWTRGTPLGEAKTMYEGQATDLRISAWFDETKGFERHFVVRMLAFYNNERFLQRVDGELQKVDVPNDASTTFSMCWRT